MSARFAVGDTVTWRINNAYPLSKTHISKTHRRVYGVGPFSVLKIDDIPANCRAIAAHSQWVTIKLPRGREMKLSGIYLTHV